MDDKVSKVIAGVWLRDTKDGKNKFFSGSVDSRATMYIELEETDESGPHIKQYKVQYFRITRNQKKQKGDKKPEYVMWGDLEEIARLDKDGKELDEDIPF